MARCRFPPPACSSRNEDIRIHKIDAPLEAPSGPRAKSEVCQSAEICWVLFFAFVPERSVVLLHVRSPSQTKAPALSSSRLLWLSVSGTAAAIDWRASAPVLRPPPPPPQVGTHPTVRSGLLAISFRKKSLRGGGAANRSQSQERRRRRLITTTITMILTQILSFSPPSGGSALWNIQ